MGLSNANKTRWTVGCVGGNVISIVFLEGEGVRFNEGCGER